MCLVAFALDAHPEYRLVLAGNRDEFIDRPAAALAPWAEAPDVIAGRDLRGGGTWLGVTRSGKWAVLTNVRDPQNPRPARHSRGVLPSGFLTGTESAAAYADAVADRLGDFDGFNLVVGDPDGAFVVSTRGEGVTALGPGVYGLSNDRLDTAWPKVVRARWRLRDAVRDIPTESALLDLLDDTEPAPDGDLPDTGVGLAWERRLSPVRIVSEGYGTRVSTAVLLDRAGHGALTEQTWRPDGTPGAVSRVRF